MWHLARLSGLGSLAVATYAWYLHGLLVGLGVAICMFLARLAMIVPIAKVAAQQNRPLPDDDIETVLWMNKWFAIVSWTLNAGSAAALYLV